MGRGGPEGKRLLNEALNFNEVDGLQRLKVLPRDNNFLIWPIYYLTRWTNE